MAVASLYALPAPAADDALQEIHGDWQVACAPRAGVRRCAMLQQQASSQNKQRVLAVELTVTAAGAEGMLVLPFGLSLDYGIRLQIDADPAGRPLHFRTCIPAGCLVPLAFDAPALVALRSAQLLKIHAATADGGNAAVFSISLRGFAEALDRAVNLAGSAR